MSSFTKNATILVTIEALLIQNTRKHEWKISFKIHDK